MDKNIDKFNNVINELIKELIELYPSKFNEFTIKDVKTNIKHNENLQSNDE